MLKNRGSGAAGARLAAGVAAVVLMVVVVWVLFVPVTDLLAHHDVGSVTGSLHETAVDNARGRLLTLGAGLFAAGALWFTARSFTLAREGQVTDRYTAAITQLGSEKLDVRIGGIYALERVARDSERDHPTVMEVLTAFIREHSHEPLPEPDPQTATVQQRDPQGETVERSIRADVQAAIAVVARRDVTRDIRRVDLRTAYLAGANLAAAPLSGADLSGADLSGADLKGADLSGAGLSDANLTDANFIGAVLLNVTGLGFSNKSLPRLDGAWWSADAPVPDPWERDTWSGRLRIMGSESDANKSSGFVKTSRQRRRVR